MVFAVIVIVWIMAAVFAVIIVGGIVLAVRNRRNPEDLAEHEADRAAARASLATEKRDGETAVRHEEGGFN